MDRDHSDSVMLHKAEIINTSTMAVKTDDRFITLSENEIFEGELTALNNVTVFHC